MDKSVLPTSTLAAWMGVQCNEQVPLFSRITTAGTLQPGLTDQGIYRVVVSFGGQAGIKARPHGLRHSAITNQENLYNGSNCLVFSLS